MIDVVPFGRKHAADLLTWFPTEAALVQWGGPGVRFPLDAAQLEAVLAEAAREPPTRLAWAGLIDGATVAHAQAVLEAGQGVARLARVAVAPAQRGRGLALSFLRTVLERIWAMPEIERIELNVRAENAPAIATCARLGFVPEGVRRSATRVGSERWDIATFGLLRSERDGRGFHARPSGHEMAAADYPLTPIEAWLVMRGYEVRPARPVTIDSFLQLPGKLEMAGGHILLWNA